MSYFCLFEIFPLAFITYILRKSNFEENDDELPSVFNSFANNEFRSTESSNLANKIFTVFSSSSTVSMIKFNAGTLPSASINDNLYEEVYREREHTN